MEKVSIIMSAYNRQDTIAKSIESVINQTYKNWELIIVNDQSTDNTENVIKRYLDDSRIIYVVNEKNMGAGYSRWNAFNYLTGDYIMFLDSDDYFNKDNVAKLVNASKIYDADFVNCGVRTFVIEADGEKTLSEFIPQGKMLIGKDVFYIDKGDISGRFLSASLTRKKMWDDVEYCKRRFIEDMPPLNKILTKCNKRVVLDYIGVNYGQTPDSLMHEADESKHLIYRVLSALDTLNWEKHKKTNYFNKNTIVSSLGTIWMLPKNVKEQYKSEIDEISVLIDKLNEEES